MSVGLGLTLLLLYPAVIYLIPEPSAFVLGWKSGKLVFPSPIARLESQKNGRILLFLKFIVVAGTILLCVRKYQRALTAQEIGRLGWRTSTLIGLLGGVFLSFWRKLAQASFPRLKSRAHENDLANGPAFSWILIFISGSFCEELWRTVSLLCLGDLGIPLIVFLTSICFALAELGGTPSRLLGIWEDVVATAIVGALLAGLFLSAGSLFANCLANLTFNLLTLYALRRGEGRAVARV
jgi:hypothetical protein